LDGVPSVAIPCTELFLLTADGFERMGDCNYLVRNVNVRRMIFDNLSRRRQYMASNKGLIDPSTLVAMFSAALQAIQTW
jgi:hypothetical protein